MTLIYGTHGTSRSYAEDIQANGFNSKKLSPGRHGKGVYLWGYNIQLVNTKERAMKVAKAWHTLCFNQKRYDSCPKKSCVILDCSSDVELLDLGAHENLCIFKEFLESSTKRIEKMKLTGSKIPEQQATHIYGLFVKMKGQSDGKNYNAVHVTTKSPLKQGPTDKWQRFNQVDLDSCYVIHDTNTVEVIGAHPTP